MKADILDKEKFFSFLDSNKERLGRRSDERGAGTQEIIRFPEIQLTFNWYPYLESPDVIKVVWQGKRFIIEDVREACMHFLRSENESD
jgi:hypothetical protein